MAHEIGAQETVGYGRNDRFEGGPVGGGRFWTDDSGNPVAKIGGPSEWRLNTMIDVRVGDTFTVSQQVWKITDIVDADSPGAYLVAVRIG
ncbi:hypothetical protein FHX37_2419 [Haloactinospora alba]|uniref:Uncharacterized protein n=1 Tax=Haloactinospora alba TaxID=405555 RepID=A0A543NKX1_9ACTN|nr:DUF6406 domain-containing protein [Haloactinospora alba]TQN32459.1 hypothetical protein FHX37_2419 [Haloactinospora alba]